MCLGEEKAMESGSREKRKRGTEKESKRGREEKLAVLTTAVDPGNYATDIAAGATYRFNLLFIVLLSNLFAIFLQSLAIKLGTVTGLDLSSACRAFLPRWLNYFLYALAEIAIIATDIAEVSRPTGSPPAKAESRGHAGSSSHRWRSATND